jgi:multiple sugar transport system permease protein
MIGQQVGVARSGPAGRQVTGSARASHATGRVTLYVGVWVLGLVFAFPLYWAIITSLKTERELYYYPPHFVPDAFIWTNYVEVVTKFPFAQWFLNTSTITALNVVGATVTGTIVAYSFARFRYPGRELLFMITLGTMMFPAQITLIPTFILFKLLGWVNTLYPLIIPPFFGGGAFTIFLLRQFIMSIPRDLDEAAVIDGASYPQILWSVLVPLTKPAIATVAIIHFIGAWNDFLGPLIYLNKPKMMTLAVGLRYFQTQPSDGRRFDHYMMAMVVMTALPCIILFFAAQRYFVQGIVMSGIKG